MSSTPWVSLYPSDYLADTAHLGLTEHGVYWRLLLHYYQHRSPLPGDLDKLCRIVLANTPEERRTVEYILTEFFVLTISGDGGRVWRHARADKEIADAQSRQAVNIARAQAAAAARWKRQDSMLGASVKHSTSNAQEMPSTTTTTTTSTKSEERERDTPPATRSAPAPSAELLVSDQSEPIETKRSRKAVEQTARGTRLPADWVLSAELGNWAMAEGLTREQVIREAETFRDYWIAKPGAGGRKADWDATWRNWIRKSDEYRNRGGNHAGQREQRETPLQASLREAEEILQRARDGTLGPEWDFSDNGDDVFGSVHPPERALPAQGGGGVPGEAARRLTNT